MSTGYTDIANAAAPEPPPSPMLVVLRSRPYQLLWGAQFASLVAGFFNYVAVAWLVLNLTGSTLAVGSVLAAASIPAAILMLLGGAASDRFSPRTSMLAAGVVRGAVVAILAGLTLVGEVQLWQLVGAAVLVGSTTAFYVPASTAMVPRLIEGDQLQAGNALLNLSRTAAMVLGSALAGIAVAAVGPGPALLVDAAASGVAALLVVPLPGLPRPASPAPPAATTPAARAPGPRGNALADVREGLLYAWRDTPLRATLVLIAVLNFAALGAIEVGLPALAFQRFSEGAAALGTAFAAWGIGSTVGSIGAGTRAMPARFGWFMLGSVALMGPGIALAGLAPNLAALVAVMVVLGVVEGASTTYLLSWLQRRTEPGMQGRVMALAMLASVGLEPLALAIAGAVAATSLSLLFWASAAAIDITAVLAGLSRSVRRM